MKEVQALAASTNLDLTTVSVHQAEEIAPAIEKLKGRAAALYVCATPFINTNRFDINSAALAAGLPTMHGFREAVDSGALMSYGPNFPDLFRRRRLCRQDTSWCKAGRYPGRTANQIRSRHQSEDG